MAILKFNSQLNTYFLSSNMFPQILNLRIIVRIHYFFLQKHISMFLAILN